MLYESETNQEKRKGAQHEWHMQIGALQTVNLHIFSRKTFFLANQIIQN